MTETVFWKKNNFTKDTQTCLLLNTIRNLHNIVKRLSSWVTKNTQQLRSMILTTEKRDCVTKPSLTSRIGPSHSPQNISWWSPEFWKNILYINVKKVKILGTWVSHKIWHETNTLFPQPNMMVANWGVLFFMRLCWRKIHLPVNYPKLWHIWVKQQNH